MNTSRQTISKELSISSPKTILSYNNKKKAKNSKRELSKNKISSSNDKNIQKLIIKSEIEKEEEFGYELAQSDEDNLNNIKENKNKTILSLHEKSNGDICNTNIINDKINDFKKISLEKTKDNITSYKLLYNNELNNKNNSYYELYTEYPNQKNIFSEAGSVLDLDGNQTNINNNNYSKYDSNDNIDIKNEINNIENNLKIKSSINNNFNKNKNQYILNEIIKKYIKKNNIDFLLFENKNILDNQKIKKSLILQQILISEMIKDIKTLKLEKEHLKKKFDIQKRYIIEHYEKQINNILQEKINDIKINKIINDNITLDNGKFKVEGFNNNLYTKMNDIKNNKNLIEKDAQDLKIKQLLKENKDFINNENKNEKNILIIIDNFYETIKLISNKFKIFINNNNYFNNDKFINKNLKDFINNKNINNNGNNSINDKLLTINEFNNIIYLELDYLYKYFKDKNIFPFNINNYSLNTLNNIFKSENGQNNIINNNINNANKKYYNERIFRKIDAIINKNRLTKNSNSKDYLSQKSKLMNNNNNIFKTINKSTDENIKNNSNLIILNNNLLEKNSIVYKSNLSPPNNKDLIFNDITNENFSVKYNELINKILNKDGNENKYKNIKNNKLNTKVQELNNIISSNRKSNKPLTKDSINIECKNSFLKNSKKSKIPLPENLKINNNCKSKISDNLLSANNMSLKEKKSRPIYKNNSGTKSINHLNFTFDNSPYLTNYKETNYKSKIPLNENYNYINEKNERNKSNNLHYIKTDIKNNNEYIKIKDIFQNSNNSNILSNSHNSHTIESIKCSKLPVKKDNLSPNKLGNKSFTSNEKKNIYLNINENNNKKFNLKVFLKQQKLKKNIIVNTNGLDNNYMKLNFLKNKIALTLNDNNLETDKK